MQVSLIPASPLISQLLPQGRSTCCCLCWWEREVGWDSPSASGCTAPDLCSWTGGKTSPCQVWLLGCSPGRSGRVHLFPRQRQGSPFCRWLNTFVLQPQWLTVRFLRGYFLPVRLMPPSLLCPLLLKMRKRKQTRKMRTRRNYRCHRHCRCCRHCCCHYYHCSLCSSLPLSLFLPVSLFSEGFLPSPDPGPSPVSCSSPKVWSFL